MLWRLLKGVMGRKRGASRASAAAPVPQSPAEQAVRLFKSGRYAEAGMLLEQLRATGRGSVEVRAEIQEALDASIAQHPDDPTPLVFLGNLRKVEYDLAGAEACYRRAIAIRADLPVALSNLSLILRDRGEHDEADGLIARALAIEPDNTDFMFNAVASLLERDRRDEALPLMREIERVRPDDADLRTLESTWLLRHGQFAAGWDKYEARAAAFGASPYAYPEWNGEPVDNGVLLIRAEQGLGDQIMFSSCIPDAMSRVPCCVVECDPRLRSIFTRSFAVAGVYPYRRIPDEAWLRDRLIPTHQIAIGSLPRLFRRDAAAFPRHRGYLQPDPGRVDAWRQRLQSLGTGLKLGISWRGGVPGTRRALRSIPLGDWRPVLSSPNIRFVSLQYGEVAQEVAAIERETGATIHHWPELLADQDELAALVVALDLVVTVQTTVAHLAGALGKAVRILVPSTPEWRYGAAGEHMPWYPSARILRQTEGRTWMPVLARAAAELGEIAQSR